jgi:raffinose/stachyose/melibiose transport system substrate-binding protein
LTIGNKCHKIGIDNMTSVRYNKYSKGDFKLRKSLLLMLAFVMVLGLALVGCSGGSEPTSETTEPSGGGDSEPTTTTEPKKEEPVELRIVTMFGGTDPSTQVLNEQLEAFKDANPHVTIINESQTSTDGTFRTKVNTDFASGNEPDVTFFFTDSDAEKIISQGLVVPMDEILAADQAWADGFSEAALDQVREADGNIYAIPTTGYYEGLIANKTLFDEYGLDLPTDWEKFEKAISTFSDNGIDPLAASLEESYYLIEHYILAAGGQEGNTAGLSDGVHDSWVKGLNAIKTHYDMGAFPKDALTIDDLIARDLVDQEFAAMMINGSWAVGGLSPETQETSVVLPMPIMPGGKGTYGDLVAGFGSGYYLSKKAYEDDKKKDIAIELIKYLTSKESIGAHAQANGGVPAAKVEVEGLSAAALSGHKMLGEATSLSFPIDSQISAEAFTHIRTNIPLIATGEKTAEQVLKEAKDIEDSK